MLEDVSKIVEVIAGILASLGIVAGAAKARKKAKPLTEPTFAKVNTSKVR